MRRWVSQTVWRAWIVRMNPRKMLARLTKLRLSADARRSQLLSAREHFEQHDYLRLPGFIEPGLVRLVRRYMGGFVKKEHEVGSELRLSASSVHTVFKVLMNDPILFRLIRRITGCGPIGCFYGRLYQLAADRGQEFSWHSDLQDNRKVAISINLSEARYEGGTLQIRRRSRSAVESVPNLGVGDAIIFRLARRLEHRVTPVVGKSSKIAFSGWFCSRPRYTPIHREMVARSESTFASRRKHKRIAFPSPTDVVTIPNAIVSQTTGRETFVANIGTGMCYGLNETGGRIWQLMTQGRAIRSIATAIADEYAAPLREVESDVLGLAYQLAQRDLIKIVGR
jgi:hypothetical protein